jgi:hypothetical protein
MHHEDPIADQVQQDVWTAYHFIAALESPCNPAREVKWLVQAGKEVVSTRLDLPVLLSADVCIVSHPAGCSVPLYHIYSMTTYGGKVCAARY